MHWLRCTLLAAILCAFYWKDSAAQTESTTGTTKQYSKGNEIHLEQSDSTTTSSARKEIHLGQEETWNLMKSENATENLTSSDTFHLQWDVESTTFNEVKPFLLFPIIPFLFPKENEESLRKKDELSKNETDGKVPGSNPSEVKPFIFFDMAFNIRQIPLNNTTDSNDSKIINVKNLSFGKSLDETKKDSQKSRRRRRNARRHKAGFFDDLSLFPDSELDEFLPKPDLFFPDLPFHHKPLKKLSRRKRDMKKPDLKNDLKFFMDAFDEAFMRTKKELQQADPILNFLRGGDNFEGDKKDFFGDIPEQMKPNLNWGVQSNVKGLNPNRDSLTKNQESPMIIVDKVVKIGEFHVHDDGQKGEKKKKRESSNLLRKFFGGDNQGLNDKINIQLQHETNHKNDPVIMDTGRKKKKRNHHPEFNTGRLFAKAESKEIRILPQANTSFVKVGNNTTIELKKKELDSEISPTEKALKGNLLKMIDSIKSRMKDEVSNDGDSTMERLKRKINSKKPVYEDLKKNITEVLNQFLTLVRKLEVNDRDNGESFDWTENETLQNANIAGKDSRGKREKKGTFEEDYVDTEKKERQVANLNYLFLTVTLPTVCVLALLLLVCFFNLQVKGKICRKLFKPRQVFLVEDETPKTSPGTRVNKTQET